MPYLICLKGSLEEGQLLVSFCALAASLLLEAASCLVTANVMLTSLIARRRAHDSKSSSICGLICRLMGYLPAACCVSAALSLPGTLLMMSADSVGCSSGAERWGLSYGNISSGSCSLLCIWTSYNQTLQWDQS